jgi:RNA polymerase sigma-70 factor (ECF subfamily)
MKTKTTLLCLSAALACAGQSGPTAQVSLESAPPVMVKTVPVAGATNIDPGLTEIRVTYSKAMQDGSWSWSTWGEENFPETTGKPRYLADGRTCVLPVKLQAGKFYATWLNSDKFHNFKDANGRPAVPYLLTFFTGDSSTNSRRASTGKPVVPAADPSLAFLNDDQRAVLAWTDRQFRGFFDARTFDGWSDAERANLEKRLVDTLNGPVTREYYQAINTLAALRSQAGLPKLREIAFDRADKDCRDRWMAIRSLGLIGDKADVPELVHLVYHRNVNTRWWAQLSLVRITGQNFAKDWNAWGKWWNEQNGQPPFKPEIIRWWNGQPEPDKLTESLAARDRKFLDNLKPKAAVAEETFPSTAN